jgi:hypothetical protein
MKKYVKIAFLAAGVAIASFSSIKSAQAVTAIAGSCVGSGNCGTTSQGTELYGKWTEESAE